VDVPLAEIFRHVSPHSLKRRADQRAFRLPENGFNLFGNAENPYEISPREPEDAPPADSTVLDLTPDMPQGLKMGDDQQEELADGVKPQKNAIPAPASRILAPPEGMKPQRTVAAPAGFSLSASPSETSREAPAKEAAEPVILPLAPVAQAWPEEIRAALAEAIESGANLALPAGRISEGLAKGRVAFTWGQICELISSGAISPGSIDESTSLMIPLRIVAPAFLSSTKRAKTPRKGVYLDASIPAPFSGGNAKTPAVSAPLPGPEISPAEAAGPLSLQPPAEEGPAAPAPELEPEREPEAAIVPEPESLAPPMMADHGKLPETIGEVFGNPHKLDWTPAEIVQGTVRLTGVAGAVVALQEGLQVASSLPDGVKSDVVAAFLPQIFARLNQYAGEMRLGDVDDLLFTTHGAHCQIYRLGYVYFAVLGKPGESLPWHELRLISEELARQTSK